MRLLLTALLCSGPMMAFAQSLHFFGSIQASKTTLEDEDQVYNEVKNDVTISPLTTAGFSFDTSFMEKNQVLSQFIYKDSSKIDLDLLQLRHNLSSSTAVRLGKQRLPAHLLSENIQIQALLPWLTPPREVYLRTPIYSFTGASIEQSLGDYFGVHAYVGNTSDTFLVGEVEYSTESKDLIGVRLNLSRNNFTAYLNTFTAKATLEVRSKTDISKLSGSSFPSGTGLSFNYNKTYTLNRVNGFATGIQYRPRDFFILTEYSKIQTDIPQLSKMDGVYVSMGKDFAEKWTPVFTFSTDIDVESTLQSDRSSTYAFNLNYRLDYSNMLKAGVEHVNYKVRNSTIVASSPSENFEVYSLMWAFVY